MDLAATVARYEQALRTNKPFAFRLYSAFPWKSTEGTDLIQEKLSFLVGMNKAYNFPELQTPFDMNLRAEFEHHTQIAEEVNRYEKAFTAIYSENVWVYHIMTEDSSVEEKLKGLKDLDRKFNFMAQYEAQRALERLQLDSDVTGPARNDH